AVFANPSFIFLKSTRTRASDALTRWTRADYTFVPGREMARIGEAAGDRYVDHREVGINQKFPGLTNAQAHIVTLRREGRVVLEQPLKLPATDTDQPRDLRDSQGIFYIPFHQLDGRLQFGGQVRQHLYTIA